MLPNGLYAVEMKTLDGVNAVATGVAVARDGVVMGGDPYFYYTGTDSCKNGRIKGELVNNQHTPYHGTAQLFTRVAKLASGSPGRMKAIALTCTASQTSDAGASAFT
jgi:hypothetical protein